jgi:hypothetical protein
MIEQAFTVHKEATTSATVEKQKNKDEREREKSKKKKKTKQCRNACEQREFKRESSREKRREEIHKSLRQQKWRDLVALSVTSRSATPSHNDFLPRGTVVTRMRTTITRLVIASK